MAENSNRNFIDHCKVTNELDNQYGGILVEYEGKQIARLDLHKHRRTVKIARLGVEKEFRQKGIATFLVKAVFDWCKSNKKLGITVHASTYRNSDVAKAAKALCQSELVYFYIKCGFDEVRGDWLHKDFRKFRFLYKDVIWDNNKRFNFKLGE